MLSKEWTMWYLTDKGWIRGEQRADFGVDRGSKPNLTYYRVCKYKEEMGGPKSTDRIIEVVSVLDEVKSQELIEIFGKCPEEL